MRAFIFNPFTDNFDAVDKYPVGTATLVAGTVTVTTANIDTNSIIFLTGQNISGTAGELSVSSITAGTSFTITSSSNTDTRSVAWIIFENAPAVIPSAGPWLSLGFSNV